MDTAIVVALCGLAGVVITGAVTVIVALITSNKESRNAAGGALEKVLEARIILKDETIQELRDDNAELLSEKLELREQNQALRRENAQLRAEQRTEG